MKPNVTNPNEKNAESGGQGQWVVISATNNLITLYYWYVCEMWACQISA